MTNKTTAITTDKTIYIEVEDDTVAFFNNNNGEPLDVSPAEAANLLGLLPNQVTAREHWVGMGNEHSDYRHVFDTTGLTLMEDDGALYVARNFQGALWAENAEGEVIVDDPSLLSDWSANRLYVNANSQEARQMGWATYRAHKRNSVELPNEGLRKFL